MAVSVFAITQGRSSVADATIPFLSASSVVMYRQERSGSGRSGWTFFLQPFHPLLHAVIASCLLLLLLLLLLMDKGRRCLASRQGAPAAGTDVTLGWRIMARFEILLAGLLNRCECFDPLLSENCHFKTLFISGPVGKKIERFDPLLNENCL